MRKAVIVFILMAGITAVFAQNFSAMSKEDATQWVHSHIKYAHYYTTLAESQKPDVTLRTRTANCGGMALLLLDILDKYNICSAEIMLVSTPKGNHAIVYTCLLGEYLDPVTGDVYEKLPSGWRKL